MTTAPQSITSEIQKLEPSAIVELFEIDATTIGGSVLRFHAGTNGLRQNVVWQGNTYTPFPLQTTGFDFTGNGQLPRPKLVMSNATGALTMLVLLYDDLLGAKVTRRRTLAKYLDAVNFPARRNLLIRTEQFDNAPWNKTRASITGNATVSPDGTTSADKLVEDTTASNTHGLNQVFIGTAASYTFTAYAKSSERSQIHMKLFNGTSFVSATYFDLAAGTVGSGTGGAITNAGNGWYRCSINATLAASANCQAQIFLAVGGSDFYTGNGTSGAFIWGAQLEVGSSATEYQPVGATWSQNPTADPTAEFPTDIFFIDRKASETRDLVEFELASSFDVAGVQLPRRQIIQNVCPWRYRGTECGYSGTSYFDANDAPVGTLAQDVCGKRLSSCKARFGANNPLPFGSFPAAGLTR